jgi:hypothetical protein
MARERLVYGPLPLYNLESNGKNRGQFRQVEVEFPNLPIRELAKA